MPSHIKTQSSNLQRHRTALLLGAGFSAKALIPYLQQREYHIIATTRSAQKAADLESLGVQAILYSGSLSPALQTALDQAELILSSIPPRDYGDPFLAALPRAAFDMAPNARWVGYLSATSVYGDRQGQWAFEDELLYPVTQRGKNRMAAELQWLESGLPVHVFRLAGIYGPERNPFARLRAGKARAVIKDGHIVNRIHVDDIASAVLASIDTPNPVSLYNIADNNPAPPQDVLNFAAALIGSEPPKKVSHDSTDISDMARSFYVETKRISNARIKAELGWTPRYENYVQGLMATLKAENGNANAVWLAGHIMVPKADLKSVKLALPNHIRLTRQEPDCTSFYIQQDTNDPQRFQVIESFASPAAFRRHQARMKNSEWKLVSKNALRSYDIIGLDES